MEKTLEETDVSSVKSDDDENYNSYIDKEGHNDNAEDIESENEGGDSDIESIVDLETETQEPEGEEPEGEEPEGEGHPSELPETEESIVLIPGDNYDETLPGNESENVLQLDDDDDDSLSEPYEEYLQKQDKNYKEDI